MGGCRVHFFEITSETDTIRYSQCGNIISYLIWIKKNTPDPMKHQHHTIQITKSKPYILGIIHSYTHTTTSSTSTTQYFLTVVHPALQHEAPPAQALRHQRLVRVPLVQGSLRRQPSDLTTAAAARWPRRWRRCTFRFRRGRSHFQDFQD